MIEAIIGAVVFLLVQAAATVFWIGRWTGRLEAKMDARHSHIEQRLDSMDNHLSEVRDDVKGIRQCLDGHGQRISKIEGRLD